MSDRQCPGAYVRDHYGRPAYIGRPVVYTWMGRREGRITGFDGQYLLIRFADSTGRGERFHPTWEMEYPLDYDGEPMESEVGI